MMVDCTQEHLGAMAMLFVEVFNAEPWNDAWSEHSARQRLGDMQNTPGAKGVCLFEGVLLAGFALGHSEQWFVGQHFFLKEMCVKTSLQRRGLGTALLSALEERLQGQEQVSLITARDSSAQAFYERNGFQSSTRPAVLTKRFAPPASDG